MVLYMNTPRALTTDLFTNITMVTIVTNVPMVATDLLVTTVTSISMVRMSTMVNPLTPNDPYRGRTAPLTSKRCILYIYSTNISTEYFKHGIYSPSFFLKNAVCFIILTYLVPVLFTFYIQGVLKLRKIIPAPKG